MELVGVGWTRCERLDVANRRGIVTTPLPNDRPRMPQPSRHLLPIRHLTVSLAMLVLAACVSTGPAPLRSVSPVPVDVTVPPSRIEPAVVAALDEQNWRIVRPFDRGVLVAERLHGNGKVRIRSRVARGAVYLEYLSSDSFDYAETGGVATIDDRYNGWMDLLRNEIEYRVLTLEVGTPN